jgi:hypothetical protein
VSRRGLPQRRSDASIWLGKGLTPSSPGSLKGVLLVVFDVLGACIDLVRRGISVSEVFHAGRAGRAAPRPGPGAEELRLLRHVQRSGREQLGLSGDQGAAPGTRLDSSPALIRAAVSATIRHAPGGASLVLRRQPCATALG